MVLNLTASILLIICFQSFLFAFILFTNKGTKRISNRLLATFLLVLGVQMGIILRESGIQNAEPFLPWMCIFGFTYGPILYFYVTSLIYKDFNLKPKHLFHIIPVAIIFASTILGYKLCFKIGALLYVSLGLYVLQSIRAIIAYRKVLKNTRSSSHLIDLKWLQWTIIIFSITLFADIIDHYFFNSTNLFGVPIVFFVLLFLVNGMFYKGLKQPQIFLGITKSDQAVAADVALKKPNEATEIGQDLKEELHDILNFIQTNKPYTNPELSLNDLANQLQMPPRRLSFLINKHLEQSFMSFINSYRIELAQERLANPMDDKETILEVMYDVGFNSKSSFNTLFKQKTGLTPSEYKQQHA